LLILAKVQLLFQIKCKRTDLAPFAKGANPKIPFARWQVLTWGENQIEGGESSIVSTP